MNCRIVIPYDPTIGPIKTQEYLKRIAKIAGGYTSFRGYGGWIDKGGGLEILVQEPITIVDIHVDEVHVNGPKIRDLRNLCRQIAIDLDQECVYFGIGENVEYIGQK